MAKTHNELHTFSAGVNNASVAPILPFTTPGLQGWKVVCENFGGDGYINSDALKFESVVETSGTTTFGVNGSLITTNGSDNSSGWFGWTTPNMQIGAATKRFYLEVSCVLTAATMASNEMFIGFTSDQSTTAFVEGLGTDWLWDDGFGFGKLDADTEISFIAGDGETASDHQIIGLGSTFTTAVKTVLGCYYDGLNYNLYRDGIFISSTAQATYNANSPMGAVAYCKDGAGETQTLVTHYALMATEL